MVKGGVRALGEVVERVARGHMDVGEGHSLPRQLGEQHLEGGELAETVVVVAPEGAGEVRIDSLNLEVGQTAHGEDLLRGVLRGHAEPPHAGVDGDGTAHAPVLVHRFGADLPGHLQVVERADDAVFHRRGDLVGQQIAEDLDRQSERSKFQRLVDFGHAEGACTGGFSPLRPPAERRVRRRSP